MKKIIFVVTLLFISSCSFGDNSAVTKYEFMGCNWLINPEYKLLAGRFQRDPQNLNEKFRAINFYNEPFTATDFEHHSREDGAGYMELISSFKVNDFKIGIYLIKTERILMGAEIKSVHRWTYVIKGQSIASFYNIELEEFKEIAAECMNFSEPTDVALDTLAKCDLSHNYGQAGSY